MSNINPPAFLRPPGPRPVNKGKIIKNLLFTKLNQHQEDPRSLMQSSTRKVVFYRSLEMEEGIQAGRGFY